MVAHERVWGGVGREAHAATLSPPRFPFRAWPPALPIFLMVARLFCVRVCACVCVCVCV